LPDGRFTVICTEPTAIYVILEQFEPDDYGETAENHVFV
jgi:phenylpyruvate tautomerase PptA (4-oxalocrotonate tautomerase family)